jgi:hypothetical protein
MLRTIDIVLNSKNAVKRVRLELVGFRSCRYLTSPYTTTHLLQNQLLSIFHTTLDSLHSVVDSFHSVVDSFHSVVDFFDLILSGCISSGKKTSCNRNHTSESCC